jgi:ABC-2 type transport system ATP-binding protein
MIETETRPPPVAAGETSPVGDFAVVIENMVKRYGRTTAVNGLSMHVPKGSVYGFVGPNGAGKTTTIRTLATLQRPDSGTAFLAGHDVVKEPKAVRDRVGYMPDFFGVYERLTLAEYLDFYGDSHRIPSAKRKQLSDELLELVDLTDKRNEQVEVLSRGMKQRLGLARSLIHDPEVLLLDEPASGMDPRARIELREILRELSRMGKTILISSHILPELAEMCTDIGIIHSGHILAEGPVNEVVASLTNGPQLEIRLLRLDDRPAAERVIESTEGCRLLEPEDGEPGGDKHTLAVDFRGTAEDMASLLHRLHEAGVAVTRFGMEAGTLEDVFLSVTDLREEDQGRATR